MNRALLITYEPALFLLIALGWAGWEWWKLHSESRRKPPERAHDDEPSGGGS